MWVYLGSVVALRESINFIELVVEEEDVFLVAAHVEAAVVRGVHYRNVEGFDLSEVAASVKVLIHENLNSFEFRY